MTDAVERFITEVKSIGELDYGDFMRKANHHFIILQEQLGTERDKSVQDILFQIKLHLQYTPNWNIESTRNYLLNEIELLNTHIQ